MVEKKGIPDELIDALLTDYEKPADLLGKNGILEQLTKRIVERALAAEMTYHLGHEKHGRVTNATGNTRNGTSKKTLKGQHGELTVAIPRDRGGSFEPRSAPRILDRCDSYTSNEGEHHVQAEKSRTSV